MASPTSMDSFGAKGALDVAGKSYEIYRLSSVTGPGLDVDSLPYSLKILLENLLRTEDGADITAEDIREGVVAVLGFLERENRSLSTNLRRSSSSAVRVALPSTFASRGVTMAMTPDGIKKTSLDAPRASASSRRTAYGPGVISRRRQRGPSVRPCTNWRT